MEAEKEEGEIDPEVPTVVVAARVVSSEPERLLSPGAVALLESLSCLANHSRIDSRKLSVLAEALHCDGVECWRDLVQAKLSDFPAVVSASASADLCSFLCDLATRRKDTSAARCDTSPPARVAPLRVLMHRSRSPAARAASVVCVPSRSRSPVTVGSEGFGLDTATDVLGMFQVAKTAEGRLFARQGLAMGGRQELVGMGTSLKPAQANKALKVAVGNGMCPNEFLKRARVEAVIGSAPTTIGAAASALRCYAAFADAVLLARGCHLPPSLEGLVAFSCIFSSQGTFKNYLAGIRLGCDLAGVEYGQLFWHPLIRRAKQAVGKRMPPARPKRFISLSVTAQLCEVAKSEGDVSAQMLYILSYAFLLRVRSEGLMLTVGNSELALAAEQHSAFSVVEGQCKYRLARRKNMPRGSLLVRRCWCHRSKATCPVHVLGAWLMQHPLGTQPFARLCAQKSINELRRRLAIVGVANSAEYILQDFRRGHAQDLVLGGARLNAILAAGQWRSAAFLKYIDVAELEARAVLEAHFALSDNEGE